MKTNCLKLIKRFVDSFGAMRYIGKSPVHNSDLMEKTQEAKKRWEERKAELKKMKPKNEEEAIWIERERTRAAMEYLGEVVKH